MVKKLSSHEEKYWKYNESLQKANRVSIPLNKPKKQRTALDYAFVAVFVALPLMFTIGLILLGLLG
jgi:hypothetical protein|tara:strand:+ start:645 stop:842 length:198 start_codon:yes stop_codon:yes gene_type:complete